MNSNVGRVVVTIAKGVIWVIEQILKQKGGK